MRYLVTGGAGFIGSNYVRMQLSSSQQKNLEIIVLDNFGFAASATNLASYEGDSRLVIINGDIKDEQVVSETMKNVDVVVNFAAESHVDRSLLDPAEFIRSNIVGVETLMRRALENKVRRFIQISTDEVYGSIAVGESSEIDVLLPNSPYSASKASADLLVRSYVESFGLNASITRCCNNFGPYQFPEKLIPLFITNLIQGKKVPIYGKGENIREWIHVDDHCIGIEKVVQHGKRGEIYNIGTSNRISNIDLTLLLLTKLGQTTDSIQFVVDRPSHDFRYALNSNKIFAELGLRVDSDFASKISQTVDWYKENSHWWLPLIERTRKFEEAKVRSSHG